MIQRCVSCLGAVVVAVGGVVGGSGSGGSGSGSGSGGGGGGGGVH